MPRLFKGSGLHNTCKNNHHHPHHHQHQVMIDKGTAHTWESSLLGFGGGESESFCGDAETLNNSAAQMESSSVISSCSSCNKKRNSLSTTTTTTTTMTAAIVVVDSETQAMTLLQDLNKAIVTLGDRKNELQESITTASILACARFKSGTCTMGSLIPMRRLYRHKMIKSYTVGARFQLIEMRKQIKQELDRARDAQEDEAQAQHCPVDNVAVHVNLDFSELRRTMDQVLTTLQTTAQQCTTPTNECLLKQLEQMAGFDDNY